MIQVWIIHEKSSIHDAPREEWRLSVDLFTDVYRKRYVKEVNYLENPFVLKGAQSRRFELFWPRIKLSFKWRRPENGSLLWQKKTKEIMLNH